VITKDCVEVEKESLADGLYSRMPQQLVTTLETEWSLSPVWWCRPLLVAVKEQQEKRLQ
jgi:hypothetical protein